MTTWRGRMLAAAGWLFVLTTGALAAPPSPAELRTWLSGLDAEAYAAREEAGRKLVLAGESAIDVLAEGVNSSSPEAAWRASAVLAQIALGGDEAVLSRVSAALTRLSQNGRPGLSQLAQELHVRQAKLRHDRAVAKVRSLGGRFGSENDDLLALGGGFFGGLPAFVEVIDDVVDEKIAEDVKMLVEGGGPAVEKSELEIPPALKAFEEALEVVGVGRKPAEPNAQAPVPPPDFPPPDAPPPDAPPVAIADAAGEAIAPPPAAEGIEIAAADIFIADAVGFDFGFAGMSGDEQPSESLALDSKWQGGDDGLAVLRDLPDVVSLTITDAKLTDSALAHIAALPRLANLELRGTMFTAAGLYKYRQLRPATRIYARGDAMLGVNADLDGPCVLSSVYYGSGAYEAGLAQGDEIVQVDGQKVADFSDLTIAVFTHRPGEKLQVEFKRDGKQKSVGVILKDRRAVESGRR